MIDEKLINDFLEILFQNKLQLMNVGGIENTQVKVFESFCQFKNVHLHFTKGIN